MRGTRRHTVRAFSLFGLSLLITLAMLNRNSETRAFSRSPGLASIAGGDNVTAAKIWVGLKDRGAVGLKVDLLVEVFASGTLVSGGQLNNVRTGGGGFSNAILHMISLSPGGIPDGTELALEVFARQTCSGTDYSSGTVRLWYGGPPVDSNLNRDAGSRVEVIVDSVTDEYFLREGLVLSADPGSVRTFVDVFLNSKAPCPGRPFTSFATWRIVLP